MLTVLRDDLRRRRLASGCLLRLSMWHVGLEGSLPRLCRLFVVSFGYSIFSLLVVALGQKDQQMDDLEGRQWVRFSQVQLPRYFPLK